MFSKEILIAGLTRRGELASTRLLCFYAIALLAVISVWTRGARSPSDYTEHSASLNAQQLDRRLQEVATSALGDRRGAIVVMDPQTGRLRAVVNPGVAFEQNVRPGSTIKPFTTLVALRAGLITENSQTLCHEKYSHDDYQTTCSHPRDLPPLNPTEAIAYSCNYFFGTLGEHMAETSFGAALGEFGFGKKTGVEPDESRGKLVRTGWRSQNAIGEGDNLEATPLQVVNAYSTLVNGGYLFRPRVASATSFVPELQSKVTIKKEHRNLILKGMRGAVRYGTAEAARLYSLPVYIFGKTGTASEIDGFRTQGWFVGFASRLNEEAAEESVLAPENVEVAVLVFLEKAHGSDASEVARPIFAEYARWKDQDEIPSDGPHGEKTNETLIDGSHQRIFPASSGARSSRVLVRVHQVRENITREMEIEDYLLGVVAAEAGAESELEALKALAVAGRTYALKNLGRHKHEGYDFCSTTHCQRYSPVDSTSDISSPAAAAVNDTRGEVLQDAGNRIVDSYFSASCGGATANLATLWGPSAPSHLRGVADEFCLTEPHHAWTDVISSSQLLKALQSDPRTNVGEHLTKIIVSRRDATGRAETITIEGKRKLTVSGWDFKIVVGRALGWNMLKSSRFEVTHSGSSFVFHGSGFGHGLGLCQEGAHVMAGRGARYSDILAKYFPTTRVAKIRTEGRPFMSLDLIWNKDVRLQESTAAVGSHRSLGRQTLSSENFRISYPARTSPDEASSLMRLVQSSRRLLLSRLAAVGVSASLPYLEIFVNETTGDFVGRTGHPAWAAAATNGRRIELQPIATLKRRQVLETTVRHELVHSLVDSVGKGRAPRWLAEGLAIHYAGEGRLVSRYSPQAKMTRDEIERALAQPASLEQMRAAYASAYREVKRLISEQGEAEVWRRVAM